MSWWGGSHIAKISALSRHSRSTDYIPLPGQPLSANTVTNLEEKIALYNLGEKIALYNLGEKIALFNLGEKIALYNLGEKIALYNLGEKDIFLPRPFLYLYLHGQR